jgi:hypothetical protein
MNGTKNRVKPDLARRQLWYVVRQGLFFLVLFFVLSFVIALVLGVVGG